MGRFAKNNTKNTNARTLKTLYSQFFRLQFWKTFLLSTDYLNTVSVLLLLFEVILGVFIIQNVKYTEIDWKAYMQEVEGFLNGTHDYSLLKGDTGPLVYPAGFVYIYSLLYFLTKNGSDVRCAQYIFLGLYVLTLHFVFRIYRKSKKVPAYCLILMCLTTYRIHSLFMLRLFNDPIAVLLFYISLNLFLDNRWSLGSLIFSLAVSVKMNILLYSPALLLVYLTSLGLKNTILQLSISALIQIILGLPFLIENPYAYVKGSFDIGRIFLHQWTVNWRFIPNDIFIDRTFHFALLLCHLLMILVFSSIFLRYLKSYASLKHVQEEVTAQLKKIKTASIDMNSVAQLLLYPIFVTNFIGIVFSRSLHYQFYVWYYHSLPYLLWCTSYSVVVRLTLLGIIELCWNTYPSTDLSSVSLLVTHVILLYGLYKSGRGNLKEKKIK